MVLEKIIGQNQTLGIIDTKGKLLFGNGRSYRCKTNIGDVWKNHY